MPGYGTGYPNWFMCPKLRRIYPRDNFDKERHRVLRTGGTKRTPRNGHGHPRKLWTMFEYECSCGHHGWTSHVDILHYPLKEGAVEGPTYGLRGMPT